MCGLQDQRGHSNADLAMAVIIVEVDVLLTCPVNSIGFSKYFFFFFSQTKPNREIKGSLELLGHSALSDEGSPSNGIRR